jgi:hypothetical protein
MQTNYIYIRKKISLVLLGCLCLAHYLPTQAQSKIKKYVGSSQFFDIAGEWVNKSDTASQRITRMNISPTIVNTYRIKPYFKLGKKELPAPSTPIQVSEVELCYTGLIADAKCFIIPTISDGVQRLKVYSVIIDPAGRWTGLGIDQLERKPESVLPLHNSPPQASAADTATTKPYIFNTKDLLGHWQNEWQYEQVIPRLQIVEIGGRLNVKIYRIINDRERALGVYPVIKHDKTDHAQVVEYLDGEIKNTMRLRPIILDNKIKGIDVTIEQFFIEGSPKGIFRQFFAVNPNGAKIAAAEELIKQLEGEWENVDVYSPTSRLVVRDGEAEVWAKSKESITGEMILGRRPLAYIEGENNNVGTTLPGAAFRRKLEIDINLAINSAIKKTEPDILVLTSHTEDIEGVRPNRTMTEVFRRKGVKILPAAFGIQETNNSNDGKGKKK